MARVFILGIDGGEWRIIDHLLAAGELPNLAALARDGARLDLRSTVPPLTPAAWASFYTGCNPGGHGVVDFLARREGSYTLVPVHRAMVSGRTLWQMAAGGGKKSLIINLPVTYPPDALEGWMVSGMDTPSPRNSYTHPPALKGEILARFPGYRPDVHISRRRVRHERDLRRWYAREVLDLERTRMEVAAHLLSSRPWDLAVAVLVSADRLQHVFWKSAEEALRGGGSPPAEEPAGSIFEAYRDIDRFLPGIIDRLGPDGHLMVISDHGFGPLEKDVNLNVLLARLGYLRFRKPPALPEFRRRLAAAARTALPAGLRRLLLNLLPSPGAKRLEGLDLLEEVIDWENTRAYALGYLGGIYLNLRGREPRGIVSPEDRERTVRELSEALSGFTDPDDGLPLVTGAALRDDIYRGHRVSSLPDLVLTLKNHRATARHSASGPGAPLFSRPQEELGGLAHTGSHRPLGIFIGAGPRFRGWKADGEPSLTDILPTCLDLLGLPVPGGLDGRSLLGPAAAGEAATTGEAAAPGGSPLSPDEEREVLDNLRGLGYL